MPVAPSCDDVACFAPCSKALRKGPYFITLAHGKQFNYHYHDHDNDHDHNHY